jgi:hypothetical protein
MSTSDLIALGTLAVAITGLLAAGANVVYRAARERRRVTVSPSRESRDGSFFVTELQFPNAQTTACVSRVGFPVSIVITNGGSIPLVVSNVGMDDSSGRIDPPVGGAFRYLAVAGGVVEFSEPIHFPHQIPAHDALALSGLFQVSVPSDTGLPLFRLYCSTVNEQKMKEMVNDLQSQLPRTVDLAPIGLKLVEVQVPAMFIKDKLLQLDGDRALVKPQFGIVSLGDSIACLGYCQKHGLALPLTEVPTSTRLVVKFANRKSVVHTFEHSANPLWFLFSGAG